MQHSLEKIPFAGRKKLKRCNNLMLLQKQSNISIKPKYQHFKKKNEIPCNTREKF